MIGKLFGAWLGDKLAGKHEGAKGEGRGGRAFEDQHQQRREDDGGNHAAGDRAAPGRRRVGLLLSFATGAGTCFGLLTTARTTGSAVGIDPTALRAPMLAAALLPRLSHIRNLDE